MASPARSVRLRPAFTATSPKTPPVRNRKLHITGAQHQPSSFLKFQNRVAELGRTTEKPPPAPSSRPFNTHRALKAQNDASPIDLCYFPQREVPTKVEPELGRVPLIPLLPSSRRPQLKDLQHGEAVADSLPDEVRRITTSSGVGVDEGTVTVMGEAEEGADLIADAKTRAAAGAESVVAEARGVWNGFMDDLLGPRRA